MVDVKSYKKVLIVAAIHGDETYGIDLYAIFIKKYPELKNTVSMIIGNPEAFKKDTRFIDQDMNRAFNSGVESSESRAIERLTKSIRKINPDYIIDIHTTRRDSGNFFITDNLEIPKSVIMKSMPNINVCIMKHDIITKSFIGNNKRAISLEFSLSSINDGTSRHFTNGLHNLVTGAVDDSMKNKIYTVKKLIDNSDYKKHTNLKNYQQFKEGLALMVPTNIDQMSSSSYYGFWCEENI